MAGIYRGGSRWICLESNRLALRNVDSGDADTMFDYRNDEVCAKFQRGQAKDAEGISALIARHTDDAISTDALSIVTVALKRTNELVGEIMVMPIKGTISMGRTFSYKHYRKGYALEVPSALIDLLHQRFSERGSACFTELDNILSAELLKKLGHQGLSIFHLGSLKSLESGQVRRRRRGWLKKQSDSASHVLSSSAAVGLTIDLVEEVRKCRCSIGISCGRTRGYMTILWAK